MKITQSEFRTGVVSNCCDAKIYDNTDECSDCLEHCSFLIEEPTAFHKWIIQSGQSDTKLMVKILRAEIIKKQNPLAFQLMEFVDMGEKTFDTQTLIRAVQMLIETKYTTNLFDNKEN